MLLLRVPCEPAQGRQSMVHEMIAPGTTLPILLTVPFEHKPKQSLIVRYLLSLALTTAVELG